LGLLKKNNLLPTVENPVQTKAVYEAFVKFDDKPMISNLDAVQNSLQKYCNNGEFAIATGESGSFKNVFYKETVPFFEVTDPTYWLVDKTLFKEKIGSATEPIGPTAASTDTFKEPGSAGITDSKSGSERRIKSLTISGKVAVENYNQIFTSFIQPLLKNNVDIRIEIKAKTNQASPITENSIQYKITKESAKQLGLRFEEEE